MFKGSLGASSILHLRSKLDNCAGELMADGHLHYYQLSSLSSVNSVLYICFSDNFVWDYISYLFITDHTELSLK